MWLTPPEWKADVLRAMEKLGISRAELSRRVQVTDAAITILFRKTTKQSRLVPAINRVLKLTAPTQNTGEVDELRARLDDSWANLDDEARRMVSDLAEKLARRDR